MVDLKAIWASQKSDGDIIIKTRINEIPHLNCYAATNHITGNHLYLMAVSKDVKIPELKTFRFKGVEIFSVETDQFSELHIYLLDNNLKDIFSLFIQDILENVSKTVSEVEAVNETLNIIGKWKKLFEKMIFTGLSGERQKGLLGELLFFLSLIETGVPSDKILYNWTGPDYEDKDFIFGSTGIEIKFTSSKHPQIKISSERQLDESTLDELFLILYTGESVKKNGESLNSAIEKVRDVLDYSSDQLKYFNEKLLLIGYRDEDKEHYNRMYSIKKTFFYKVTSDFPKITKTLYPVGIFGVSYCIELSAAEPFSFPFEEILNSIN